MHDNVGRLHCDRPVDCFFLVGAAAACRLGSIPGIFFWSAIIIIIIIMVMVMDVIIMTTHKGYI
jgi:hypothetical protein